MNTRQVISNLGGTVKRIHSDIWTSYYTLEYDGGSTSFIFDFEDENVAYNCASLYLVCLSSNKLDMTFVDELIDAYIIKQLNDGY